MTSKIPPGISLYEIMLNKLPYTVEDVDGRPAFPSLAPPLREFTALLMRTLAELRIEYPPIPAQATSQPSSVTVITDQAPAKFAQDVAREVSRATAGLSPAAACLETTITAELPDGRTASVSTLSRAEEPVISPSADQPGVYTILGAKNDVTDAKIASQPPLTFEPSEAEVVQRIAAPEDALSEFKEGQWWVKELDHMAGHNPGGDLARAVAVVHNLLRASLDYQSEREDAENVIRQQAEQISRLSAEIDQLRAPGHQPYPEMPPPSHRHPMSGEPIWDQHAVKAAMKDAHDRGYSVGWDNGHEHAVKASAPVADAAPKYAYSDDGKTVTMMNTDRAPSYRASAPVANDYEKVLADHRRLVRELDVLLNGDGAAEQASLCDIVSQVRREGIKASAPVAPTEVMDALNWVDDFIARCNSDDRGSCESVSVLRRALASTPAAGHAFRALLDRSKVPGKDYLYCIKPSEIDAAIGEASAPTVAESLNRCEQSTPTLMESNNGAARILADITLTGTTPAERFDEERKHFAWNKP